MTISELLIQGFSGLVHQYKVIDTSVIEFSEEVVKACKANYCGQYGKSWMCPPGVGELKYLKQKYLKYNKGFVFTTKHQIEDSFDFEGMNDARIVHNKVASNIYNILDRKKYDYLVLGTEGCDLCKKCSYPNFPCVHPDIASPSIEAVGINVVKLSRDIQINYINGENTVTYFSMVFFNE